MNHESPSRIVLPIPLPTGWPRSYPHPPCCSPPQVGRVLIATYFFNEALTVLQTSPYLASYFLGYLSDGVWQARPGTREAGHGSCTPMHARANPPPPPYSCPPQLVLELRRAMPISRSAWFHTPPRPLPALLLCSGARWLSGRCPRAPPPPPPQPPPPAAPFL